MRSLATIFREGIKDFSFILDYLVWLALDPCKFRIINKKKIKKVLIVHLGAIGDILVVSPILPVLKKELGCEISFMVSKSASAVFEQNPYLSEILIYEEDFKKNVENLKKRNFDTALIIRPGSIKLSLACMLAGIKNRIGCSRGLAKGPGFLFTRRFFPLQRTHAVEQNLEMIRQLGLDNKNPKVEVYLSEKEKQNAKKILKKMKVKDYFIVHPGFGFSSEHKYPSRLWSLKKYAKLVDCLIKKYKVKILLTGGPDEKKLCEKIHKLVEKKNKNKAIVCCGAFGLRDFMAIVGTAKLVVEPDTGTGQIASGLNVPRVVLMGKTNYYEWGKWSKNEPAKYLFHPEVCTSCDKEYCRKKTTECLDAISVEEVMNAASKLI